MDVGTNIRISYGYLVLAGEEIHFVHKGPGKWMELRDTKHSRMIVITINTIAS